MNTEQAEIRSAARAMLAALRNAVDVIGGFNYSDEFSQADAVRLVAAWAQVNHAIVQAEAADVEG